MVTKICPWTGGVCLKVSCDSIDSMGDVQVCSRHRNPNGFHILRIRVSPVVSVFNKHGGR